MNYRFYHAKILTMETTAIMEGELWVQDDKILYVGEGGDAAQSASLFPSKAFSGTGRLTAAAIF